MSGVSYFGITRVQEDGTIAVDHDKRFDPNLSYKENADGDFYPVGPRIVPLDPAVNAAIGFAGKDVPTVVCPRCYQLVAELLPEHRIAEHRCSRVLPIPSPKL